MEGIRLRASASDRWILCPGSARAEHGLPDIPSKYSEEGTYAHEIAAERLQYVYKMHNIPIDMSIYIQRYVDYVGEIIAQLQNYQYYVEQEVDLSFLLPGEKGTSDCIVVDHDNHRLHIIDLKYGAGVKVSAEYNYQLLLYAIGAINMFKLFHFKEIVMHIVQPRLSNVSVWKLDMASIRSFSDFVVNRAEYALSEYAPRIPHPKACKFCKAKPTCRAVANTAINVVEKINKQLTQEELKTILDNSKLIQDFLNTIEEKVYDHLQQGKEFPGYKLVNGRSIRKFKPGAEEKLVSLLQESAYEKSLIGIIKAEKLLDKEILEDLTYRVTGKPLLVKASDPREPIIKLLYYFDNIENNL